MSLWGVATKALSQTRRPCRWDCSHARLRTDLSPKITPPRCKRVERWGRLESLVEIEKEGNGCYFSHSVAGNNCWRNPEGWLQSDNSSCTFRTRHNKAWTALGRQRECAKFPFSSEFQFRSFLALPLRSLFRLFSKQNPETKMNSD